MDDLVYLRAPQACSDGYGHEWPEAGAVVGVPRDQAEVLLAIQDAGFTVAEPPAQPATTREAPVEVAEPAPETAPSAAVTEPAPRRRSAKG